MAINYTQLILMKSEHLILRAGTHKGHALRVDPIGILIDTLIKTQKNIMHKILFTLLLLSVMTNPLAGSDDVFMNGFEVFVPITTNKNVFISGHSLMDNPYADYLESISIDKGVTDYRWNQQNGIGSPIRVRTSGNNLPPNNWQGYHRGKNRDTFDMDVIAELRNPMTIGAGNLYDVLLITERHDLMGTIFFEYTNSLLRHYHDRMLEGNSNAKTLFYQSWLFIDPNNPQVWIDHETLMINAWECVAEKVNLTLEADALNKTVSVIPAGLALSDLLTRILNNEVAGFTGTDLDKIDQLFDDNVHLNAEGVFYMAAVSYVSIYGTSPVGATIPVGINTATGENLLQIAWENVNNYRQNYQVKTMAACRDVMANQVCDSYYNFQGRPEQINSCIQRMNNTSTFLYNPFNWPDADLVVWPAPD